MASHVHRTSGDLVLKHPVPAESHVERVKGLMHSVAGPLRYARASRSEGSKGVLLDGSHRSRVGRRANLLAVETRRIVVVV
jgi:hypothetical protein